MALALAAASKGKEEDVAAAEFLLSSVPQRLAASLREEMEALERIKPAEAEAAQAAVVNTVRERAAIGEIELESGEEDDAAKTPEQREIEARQQAQLDAETERQRRGDTA